MQQLTITGHIGQDAQIKNSSSGDFITFSVAVSERWKDQTGEKKEKTTWYNCTYWPKSTAIAQWLRKGTKVLAQGKPTVSLYKNKHGEQVVDMGLQVSNVELLSAQEEKETSSAQSLTDPRNQQPAPVPAKVGAEDDNDLPF